MRYVLFLLLPKNWLSRLMGRIVRTRFPFGLHGLIRDRFIRFYRINTLEAEAPPSQYATLGDYFIRRLKKGERPIAPDSLVSPVDGLLTQSGWLESPDLWLTQVKGRRYSFSQLTRSRFKADSFSGGSFFTLYLAPHNYHRVHAPVSGEIVRAVHIPGALWPVNPWSVQTIDGLFAANERIIIEIKTTEGVALVILVGATNVGRISLAFTPDMLANEAHVKTIREWTPPSTLPIGKGEELGCFELGSTVVLLLDGALTQACKPDFPVAGGKPVKMGQGLSR